MLGPINIKGKAPKRYLTPFANNSLLVAIFGFVLDISGSRSSQASWVWAYASVVIWGVLFVIYERRNGWGSKASQ